MTKKLIAFYILLLSLMSSSLMAGGAAGGGGTIGKKVEILNYLAALDTSKGGVFIPDDKFIELIGVFGLKDVSELQQTGVTINQLVVKSGVSGLQGYKVNSDMSFMVFSESQKPMIKDFSAFIEELQQTQTNTFVFENH